MKRRRQPGEQVSRGVRWARQTRDKLKAMLGGACAACKATEDLEFDCLEPQGHKHHGIGFTWRMSFYRDQMRKGNLQLLCEPCNNMKGDTPQAEWLIWLTTTESKEYYRLRIKAREQLQQQSKGKQWNHLQKEEL